MGRNIEEVLNSLPPERREKIERRSAELLTEYKTRQKLKEILETSEEFSIDEEVMIWLLMLRLLNHFHVTALRLTVPLKINLSRLIDLVEELKGSLEVVVNLPGRSPVRLPIAIQEEMMSEPTVITNTPPEPPVSHALSGLLPEFLQEIQQTPKEYWPNLLQIIRLFRESVNGENLAKIFTEMSEEERIKRNQAVIELINSWVEEGDEQEQTETAEYLRQVLD